MRWLGLLSDLPSSPPGCYLAPHVAGACFPPRWLLSRWVRRAASSSSARTNWATKERRHKMAFRTMASIFTIYHKNRYVTFTHSSSEVITSETGNSNSLFWMM
ncbi:unnamed protein product [Protopolystoma xenopodis]|uniref:Uncharacterized protein n=1 Tax=Protopolystoma xenopodis TaxID=117903 RepID=A0A448WRJ1_9PLAT|nr:unnamed protein product [Protopolystoma xenopodis]